MSYQIVWVKHKSIDVKCSKVSAYAIKRHLFPLSPKEKKPYPFPLVNVRNKPKGRLSLCIKLPGLLNALVFRSVLVRLTDPKNRHVIIYTWTLGGVQTFKSSYLDVSPFFSTFSFLLCLHSHTRTFLLVTLGSGWGAIVTGLEGSSILKVAIPKGYVNSFFLIHFFFFLCFCGALLYP